MQEDKITFQLWDLLPCVGRYIDTVLQTSAHGPLALARKSEIMDFPLEWSLNKAEPVKPSSS